MKTGIVENKEMDRLILLNTENEEDFLNLCITDKYFKSLCDENMYRRRLEKYYPDILKAKPAFRTFKDWYLKNMKAKGEMKEKYNFDYKSGVPVFYINVLTKREEYENRTPLYMIDRAGNLGYLDVVDYVRNVLHQEVPDSYILIRYAGSVSLENLKVLLSLNVSDTDIKNAIIRTMSTGNYVNFKYMADTYGLNFAFGDDEEFGPPNEIGEMAALGMNEKIIDYFLDKFPLVGAISGVLRTLVYMQADPKLIQKYYKLLASKGDYLTLVESTRDNVYLFKKSVDKYVKNTKNPSPHAIDRLRDILDILLFDKKEEQSEYLLTLGLGLKDQNSLKSLDDYIDETQIMIPYFKERIIRMNKTY